MIVKNLYVSHKYKKAQKQLPQHIVDMAIKKGALFKINPLHPSLRLHELHGRFAGRWSISINKNYRIIFRRMENGDILFLSIGKHDIYKHL